MGRLGWLRHWRASGPRSRFRAGAGLALLLASASGAGLLGFPRLDARAQAPVGQAPAAAVQTVPGMPPVVDPRNLYSEVAAGKLSPVVATALPRVYVPNVKSNTVTVIDPATLTVVDEFPVGINPQHVVPSYDLSTLWVTNNAEGRTDGSLTPIDPRTAKPVRSIPVDDPYNMYFTPDGRSAIVVAEVGAPARTEGSPANALHARPQLRRGVGDGPQLGLRHAG